MGDASGIAPLGLDEVLERTAQIARDVLASHAAAVDRDAVWPEQSIRALQAAGLGGLVVPLDKGGLGHGLYALARVCELLGRECASTAICFGMHCVGSAVISVKSTPDQDERYLAPIARGEHLTTLALSEPGSGSHFYIPSTALTEGPDESYALDGRKVFVTNGAHADSYVLSTALGGANEPGLFSCVVLDADAPGIEWGESWRGMGMRGNDSRQLDMRGTRVPRGNLLGSHGDEVWYVFNVIAPYFLTAMSGTYLGVASAAFEQARSHLMRRGYSTTGRAPRNEPVVQHRLGTLWARLESARRLTYSAAGLADGEEDGALPAILSAKAEVASAAVEVANGAMDLAGGIAYGENSTLQRHLRDARAANVMAPTTDILRTWAGRALLDQPLLAD
jgi:alkylation response protein AidB-like acyl-CoA dehydrogenase